MNSRNKFDVVTFEVIRNTMSQISDSMGATMARVAFSPVIKEGYDYSSGLLTADSRLLAHGRNDEPVHIGALGPTAKVVMEDYGDDINKGDAFIMNNAYRAGTHLNDIACLKPIFYEDELVMWASNRGHHSDVGGAVPGSLNPLATEVYQEGVIIDPIRFVSKGTWDSHVVKLLLNNMRVPWEKEADFRAQISALNYAEEELVKLFQQYGKEVMFEAFEEMIAYSERVMKKFIKEELRDGVYEFEDYCDQDPAHPNKKPVRFHGKVTVEGDQMTVDFSDTDPAPISGVGMPVWPTISSVHVALINFFPVPYNDGISNSVRVITKPGTACHVLHPTAFSGFAAGAYEKTTSIMYHTLSEACPQRAVGMQYNLVNLTIGGRDPRYNGRPYIAYLYQQAGWGARVNKDGPPPASGAYFAQGRNMPLEVLERHYPNLFLKWETPRDSCGHGKFRGGMGNMWEWISNGERGKLSILGDRHKFTPWGLWGGTNGGNNGVVVNSDTPNEVELGVYATGVDLHPGDHIIYWAGGGGGIGDPLERDPQAVLEDVMDEYISYKVAQDVYGVIINIVDEETLDYRIDWEATNQKREEIKRGRESK
ncbi:MAG: hydantoinase B/oxoprolinase family protein [Pseudomonadota bacterium]